MCEKKMSKKNTKPPTTAEEAEYRTIKQKPKNDVEKTSADVTVTS